MKLSDYLAITEQVPYEFIKIFVNIHASTLSRVARGLIPIPFRLAMFALKFRELQAQLKSQTMPKGTLLVRAQIEGKSYATIGAEFITSATDGHLLEELYHTPKTNVFLIARTSANGKIILHVADDVFAKEWLTAHGKTAELEALY